MMLESKMQQMAKHVNYVEEVEVAAAVIGLHKDIMHNNHVHVPIHAHLVVV